MKFSLEAWRRRDNMWEHIEGSIELDIVETDVIAELGLYTSDPLFVASVLHAKELEEERKNYLIRIKGV